jgi:hypothetical protein
MSRGERQQVHRIMKVSEVNSELIIIRIASVAKVSYKAITLNPNTIHQYTG